MKFTIASLTAMIVALALSSCATTNQSNLALIGKYANPSAPVLGGLCVKQCQANACTDYNTLLDGCEHGLPVQGVGGSAVMAHFCPINNYPFMGTAPMIALPDSCVNSGAPTPAPSPTPSPSPAPKIIGSGVNNTAEGK